MKVTLRWSLNYLQSRHFGKQRVAVSVTFKNNATDYVTTQKLLPAQRNKEKKEKKKRAYCTWRTPKLYTRMLSFCAFVTTGY